jgi:hypothetical protein
MSGQARRAGWIELELNTRSSLEGGFGELDGSDDEEEKDTPQTTVVQRYCHLDAL